MVLVSLGKLKANGYRLSPFEVEEFFSMAACRFDTVGASLGSATLGAIAETLDLPTR
jgi:hypothetical protein